MKYLEESGKILLDARELVSIARRGIAASLPRDEDEPSITEVKERIKNRLVPECAHSDCTLDFTLDDASFTLKSSLDIGNDGKIYFIRTVTSRPDRPRREEKAQIRGEAFICALAYMKEKGLDRAEIEYVYFNAQTTDTATSKEDVDIKKLERFFERCLISLKIYAKPEIERVTLRLPSMRALKFPYDSPRAGQSEFIRRAYKTIARGGTLFATAPTGTGKTVSALYPAIRALGDGRRDKVFYLTPKETTAIAACECLELFAARGAIIRSVLIGAKQKRCKNDLACRRGRDKCPYSKENKLADAVLALYKKELTVVGADVLGEIAAKFAVCPYELSLSYAELCDVIICDFNYLFDPSVYIRRFFEAGGNYAFLIDEAHNLADRARETYSAEISERDLYEIENSDLIGELALIKKATREAHEALCATLIPYLKDEMREKEDGEKYAAAHLKELPSELYGICDSLINVLEEEIFHTRAASDEEKDDRLSLLTNLSRTLTKLRAVMDVFDSSYELFLFYEEEKIRMKLFCIDTGKEITKRLLKGEAAIFFSATLTPIYYYKSMLGADNTADELELPSPFDTSQLSVTIMDRVSTRYSEREDTLAAAIRTIAATVSARRGNYMVFAPSFQYCERLAKAFAAKYPKNKVISQSRNMTKKEKDAFLAEFSNPTGGYLIGFAVMGGIYSEGIDLAGDSLIGAVIIGIGMPALSYEREAICAYYDEKYEEGKQFAYIYPGMNRVLQAAGRVIRRENDRGVIVLVDDRFDDPIYKKIVPSLWKGMKFIDDAKALREELDRFWIEN